MTTGDGHGRGYDYGHDAPSEVTAYCDHCVANETYGAVPPDDHGDAEDDPAPLLAAWAVYESQTVPSLLTKRSLTRIRHLN